jgi:hypothetical protein
MLIDAAIAEDRNVINREAENVLERTYTMEIQRTWNVNPKVIGATGTISKSLRKYLSNISGKQEIKELQKTAILSTARKLRKVNFKNNST